MLSQKAIEDFKKLKEEQGIEYSDEETREVAENLLNLFRGSLPKPHFVVG